MLKKKNRPHIFGFVEKSTSKNMQTVRFFFITDPWVSEHWVGININHKSCFRF